MVIKRIVPKNPQIKDEFLFKLNQSLIATQKKRYASAIRISEGKIINDVPQVNIDEEVQKILSMKYNLPELYKYLAMHDFSDAVIASVLSVMVKQPPLTTSHLWMDFDGDYSPRVDDKRAELAAKVYTHTRQFASTGCEAMFMDN